MAALPFDPERIWFRISRSPRKRLARSIERGLVLDVGCGDLTKSYAFVHEVNPELRLLGVEKFDDATIYGPSHIPMYVTRGGAVSRIACDFMTQNIPVEDGSVDGVFCSHVIEHVDDRSVLLKELFRVLRPGGRLYLETPGPGSLLARKDSWMRRLAPECPFNYFDDPTHLERPLSRRELDRELADAGFVIETSGTHRDFGLLGMPLYLLLVLTAALPLLPRRLRALSARAGWWNASGWPVFALAKRPG